MNNTVKILLEINGINIDSVEENEFGDILIRVTGTVEGSVCPECGKLVTDVSTAKPAKLQYNILNLKNI